MTTNSHTAMISVVVYRDVVDRMQMKVPSLKSLSLNIRRGIVGESYLRQFYEVGVIPHIYIYI